MFALAVLEQIFSGASRPTRFEAVMAMYLMFIFKNGRIASMLQVSCRLSLSELGDPKVSEALWVRESTQVVSVIALNVVLNAFEDIELSLGWVHLVARPRQRLEHPNQTLDLLSPTILPLAQLVHLLRAS